MPQFFDEKPKRKGFLLSKFFLLLYLILFSAAASLPFTYINIPIVGGFGIDRNFVLIPSGILAFYFLVIALSFFVRGDNWLIFSIILIFFSTLAALGLAVLGGLNAQHLFNTGIPDCVNDIVACNADQGFALLSALLLGISIPTLIFNLVTFIAIWKTMGANDL